MPELAVSAQFHRGSFSLDLNFTITRWPALLFGPSGAGKSTLLRLIAGLDLPDNGRIALDGKVLVANDARRQQAVGAGAVQLVSQRPALFPHLDVRGNVAFGINRLSKAEQRARVDDMLSLLGATHLADRRITHLSGGERQRVALARALAPRPQLLLLDEAFTGLDGSAKQEILAELTELLARQNIPALHVTHEVADAFALDAEVLVIQDGRVASQGPAPQVLQSERDRLLQMLR